MVVVSSKIGCLVGGCGLGFSGRVRFVVLNLSGIVVWVGGVSVSIFTSFRLNNGLIISSLFMKIFCGIISVIISSAAAALGAAVVVVRRLIGTFGFGVLRLFVPGEDGFVTDSKTTSESGVITTCCGRLCGNISPPVLPNIAGKIIDHDDETSGVSSI